MKVLFIRFSSLGDLLLTTPIIRAFRTHFPDAELHFLTKSQFAPILENNPNINTLLGYDPTSETMIQLIIRLQKEHYTHIIDLHGKLRSGLIKQFVGGKTITYDKKHAYRKKLLKDHSLQPVSSTVDLYASVLESFNIELESQKLDLFLPENSEDVVRKFLLNDNKRPIVTISPGASWLTKQYPANYYKELIKMILDKYNPRIVLIGIEDEKELTSELAKNVNKSILDLGGKTSLMETAVIINQSDVFISGDCGPMHMAAALGKPQIAIFGPTHPVLGFSPINQNAVVLTENLDCSPCSLHGRQYCPLGHFNCMKKLRSKRVFSEVKKILQPLQS
ncbi:MAG TPA: lipopolysaccharide heptosyltransferase II [Candidatus Cloacimonetes bacterium]|nr:lipopolysaccharide heptosyltransferase II [Candidatus Cloacimonadota bacterium]HEX38018.1 lipopolysaccharide heptosyltransferase II [Candidatus Cloacimonadota bacterium]